MASIEKRGVHKWQARVRLRGHNLTKTFARRADAQAWIGETEAAIRGGRYLVTTAAERMTFGKVLEGYRDRRPRPKGAQSEGYRIDRLLKHPLSKRSAASLKTPDFERYKNGRLATVKPETVRRELNVMRAALRWAKRNIDDFAMPADPFEMLEWPKPGKGRDRRLTKAEMKRLGEALAVREAADVGRVIKNPGIGRGKGQQSARNPWLLLLVVLAIETTMRRGELLALRWPDIDLEHAIAHVRDSKNDDARQVPLSPYALAALRDLKKQRDGDDPRVIPASDNAAKLAWQRAVKRAGIENLTFHDLRHEATSRLFEAGFGTMEVAAFTGHRDLRMLKRYTHMEARRLAAELGSRLVAQGPQYTPASSRAGVPCGLVDKLRRPDRTPGLVAPCAPWPGFQVKANPGETLAGAGFARALPYQIIGAPSARVPASPGSSGFRRGGVMDVNPGVSAGA